jgi:hypothetical protein
MGLRGLLRSKFFFILFLGFGKSGLLMGLVLRFKAMEKAGTDTVAEVVEDKPGE